MYNPIINIQHVHRGEVLCHYKAAVVMIYSFLLISITGVQGYEKY